jgi:1,4-dihydroxy-6-naphthoate synthase
MRLKVAHSPDSDDAFMFYAIAHKKIDLKNYEFEFSADEIEVLNQKALDIDTAPDIVAVSFHAYAYLQNDYNLLYSGCSMAGKDYGPKLIAKPDIVEAIHSGSKGISDLKIAIPGKLTSAYLALRIYEESFPSKEKFTAIYCKFDEVFDLVKSGEVDAGLLIHESQLKFEKENFDLIVDLGEWWYGYTEGLNLPLGTNVIKKKLGDKVRNDIDQILMQSILWGKENFKEVMEYARKFAKNNLNDEDAKKYLDMYVNESTVKLSKEDEESIALLLKIRQRL